MNRFEPYHLILDWNGGQMSACLLGRLEVELTAGNPESVSIYHVPVPLDLDDPQDQKGIQWVKAKIKAAVNQRVGSDPIERAT